MRFFLRLKSAQNFGNTLKNRVSKGSRFLAIDDFRSGRGHWAPKLHTDRYRPRVSPNLPGGL